MEKNCNFCGNKSFKNIRVQYVYRRDNQFLVVNNVPCEQCDHCGEQYFQAEVLKKIEQEVKEIYHTGKKTRHKIIVPVEEFAEMG